MNKAVLGLFLILVFASFTYAQEDITITTYYPSPNGSYRTLTWGTPGVTAGILSDDQGSSIELGGTNTWPYIDFHHDVPPTDYDMRIVLLGPNRLDITGGTTVFGNDAGGSGPIVVSDVYFCTACAAP